MTVPCPDISHLAVATDTTCDAISEGRVRVVIPIRFGLQQEFPKPEGESRVIRSEGLFDAKSAHVRCWEVVRVFVGSDDLQRTNQIVSNSILVRTTERHACPDNCDHSLSRELLATFPR